MKSIFIFLICFITTHLHASYYQEECSSADATTKMNSGHRTNGIWLSKSSDSLTYQEIAYSLDELKIIEVISQPLREIQTQHCEDGATYIETTSYTYKSVIFKKTDDSLFAADIVGVSSDKTYVSADLLCRISIHSRSTCELMKD